MPSPIVPPSIGGPLARVPVNVGAIAVPSIIYTVKAGKADTQPIALVSIGGGDMQSIPLVQSANQPIDLRCLGEQLTSGAMKLALVAGPTTNKRQYLFLSEEGLGLKGGGRTIFRENDPGRTQALAAVRSRALSVLQNDQPAWGDWYALGVTLDAKEKVMVRHADGSSSEVGARDCYVNALALNSEKSLIWNNLGTTLEQGESIDIGPAADRKTMGRIDCFMKAVELAPSLGLAWNNLALSLSPSETLSLTIPGQGDADTPSVVCFSKAVCEAMAKHCSDERASVSNFSHDSDKKSDNSDKSVASQRAQPGVHPDVRALDALLSLVSYMSDESSHTADKSAGDELVDSKPRALADNVKPAPVSVPVAQTIQAPQPVVALANSKRTAPSLEGNDNKRSRLKRSDSTSSYDSILSKDFVLEGREDVDASITDVLTQIKYSSDEVTPDDITEFEQSVKAALSNRSLNTFFTSKSGKKMRAMDFAASYGRPTLAKVLLDNGALNGKGQKGRLQRNLATINEGRYN